MSYIPGKGARIFRRKLCGAHFGGFVSLAGNRHCVCVQKGARRINFQPELDGICMYLQQHIGRKRCCLICMAFTVVIAGTWNKQFSSSHGRRKFRNQTSDSMDRWESGQMGKQRWEESEKRRGEKIREEKVRRKKESREILCFSNDLWLRRVEK